MNIPKNIKIGAKNYKINKVNNDIIGISHASIDFNKGCIDIFTKETDKDIQEYILTCEILRGINNIYGVNLSENQMKKLLKGLHCFIKDNPIVFDSDEYIDGIYLSEKGMFIGKMKEGISGDAKFSD